MTEAQSATIDDARSSLIDAADHADQFLSAAIRELPDIVDHLRRQDLKPVLTSLGHLLEGLGALARLVAELAPSRTGAATDRAGAADLAAMSEALRAMVGCQERGDWEGAASVLELQIAPCLPLWKEAIPRDARRLAGVTISAG